MLHVDEGPDPTRERETFERKTGPLLSIGLCVRVTEQRLSTHTTHVHGSSKSFPVSTDARGRTVFNTQTTVRPCTVQQALRPVVTVQSFKNTTVQQLTAAVDQVQCVDAHDLFATAELLVLFSV